MANNTVYIISQKISTLLFALLWGTSYAYAVSKKDTLASNKKRYILVYKPVAQRSIFGKQN